MKPDPAFCQRPSQREAKLILLQVFGSGEKAPGIQSAVAQKLEGLSVELVAAALADHVHRSGVRSLVRHQKSFLDFELIDSSDRQVERQFAIPRTADRDAVQRVADGVGKSSGKNNHAGRVADVGRDVVVGRADVNGASREQRQLQEIAAVQWQIPDPCGIHHHPHGVAGGFERSLVAGVYRDDGSDFTDLQDHVDNSLLTHLDVEAIYCVSGETSFGYLECIQAWLYPGKSKGTGFVGIGLPDQALGFFGEADPSAHNYDVPGVTHRPTERSRAEGGLCHQAATCENRDPNYPCL